MLTYGPLCWILDRAESVIIPMTGAHGAYTSAFGLVL